MRIQPNMMSAYFLLYKWEFYNSLKHSYLQLLKTCLLKICSLLLAIQHPVAVSVQYGII